MEMASMWIILMRPIHPTTFCVIGLQLFLLRQATIMHIYVCGRLPETQDNMLIFTRNKNTLMSKCNGHEKYSEYL